jgi:hypothetical protein
MLHLSVNGVSQVWRTFNQVSAIDVVKRLKLVSHLLTLQLQLMLLDQQLLLIIDHSLLGIDKHLSCSTSVKKTSGCEVRGSHHMAIDGAPGSCDQLLMLNLARHDTL